MSARCPFNAGSRRGFLGGAAGLAAVLGTGAVRAAPAQSDGPESFHGDHQAGIITPPQHHTYFAAFEVMVDDRAKLIELLRSWTQAAAQLTRGLPALAEPVSDATGRDPARLTLTFGFGPSLFTAGGKDRYGLAAARPGALADLPRFAGDQLVAEKCGGDLSVQACADDPQVAFAAIRALARIADGAARLRWAQTGFAGSSAKGTPRNLMGFKDGTQNPVTRPSPGSGGAEQVVWVGDEGPAWMRAGSYLVVRRIRMALEHWDRTEVAYQEQVVGRSKMSGAPLGQSDEFDAPDLEAKDADGNSLIPDDAHVRLANTASNGATQILRRAYNYNDGANFTAERWPPWRQGIEYDAGLLFICYQRDPRTGFTRIFEPMAKLDAINQFTTHVGSAVFACPPGVRPGGFVGEALLAA